MTRSQKEHALAWTALAAGTAAWFVSQQAGADLNMAHCHAGGPVAIVIIGLLALALAGGGAFLSWRVWERGGGEEEGRSFIALVGVLVAALLSIAIVYQTAAALIIPSCFA
jgi:hypothetical protein